MAEPPKSHAFRASMGTRSQQLLDAVVRTTHLRTRANPHDNPDEHWMLEALHELDTAHAELQVVEEELQCKADELQDTQRALELERHAYRELFEAAPEAYLVTDRYGMIQQANVRACQLLQLPPALLTGKPLAVFSVEADRRVLSDMLTFMNSATQPASFELSLQPRGATQPIKTIASVAQGPKGEASAGSLRWLIREQRALTEPSVPLVEQDETRAQAERLARDLEGERERRAQAERTVEAANRRLAYVSHEFRNPLLTLGGWLEILEQETEARARSEIMEVLNSSVRVMSALVEELLDKARVDEALIKLAPQDVDLRELLERLCEEFRLVVGQRQLELRASIDAGVGHVRCDPLRVRQIIVNLLDNASKFTQPGGSIELSARVVSEMVEISVRDTGRGIAQDQLSQIFGPFVRVAEDDAASGLGLGLNIAQRLVDLHQGSIVAESAGLGQGATFRVRLPRHLTAP